MNHPRPVVGSSSIKCNDTRQAFDKSVCLARKKWNKSISANAKDPEFHCPDAPGKNLAQEFRREIPVHLFPETHTWPFNSLVMISSAGAISTGVFVRAVSISAGNSIAANLSALYPWLADQERASDFTSLAEQLNVWHSQDTDSVLGPSWQEKVRDSVVRMDRNRDGLISVEEFTSYLGNGNVHPSPRGVLSRLDSHATANQSLIAMIWPTMGPDDRGECRAHV
jgi:hypothetical protein